MEIDREIIHEPCPTSSVATARTQTRVPLSTRLHVLCQHVVSPELVERPKQITQSTELPMWCFRETNCCCHLEPRRVLRPLLRWIGHPFLLAIFASNPWLKGNSMCEYQEFEPPGYSSRLPWFIRQSWRWERVQLKTLGFRRICRSKMNIRKQDFP